MKAKTLTANLKWRNNHRGDRGYSVGRKWRLYRGFLSNDQVRYRTKNNGIMFASDGEYQLVHFKENTPGLDKLVTATR